MGMTQHPTESLLALDDAQDVFLRVARLLYSAAGTAELITVSRATDLTADDRLIEFDVKVVLWQVVALLPPGYRLDLGEPTDHHGSDPRDSVRSTLDVANQELRHGSLASFPAGTSILLADLTALIARLDSSPRSPTTGRALE